MKIANSIGWCDCTINAVTGCDKVSPGCKNCYAEVGTRARVLRARGQETWGANGERAPVNFEPVFRMMNNLCVCDRCHASYQAGLILAKHDKAKFDECPPCGGQLRRIRLFADSNSDWLDPKWPIETLAKFLDAIRLAPNVDVLLLTKRIELFAGRLALVAACCHEDAFYSENAQAGALGIWIDDWIGREQPPANVWLGVSVEDQKRADERIPLLLQTPAAVRFISAEPLLEKVDLKLDASMEPEISWIIVGGESGKGRRDCGVDAIKSVATQCVAAGVACYVKQDTAFKSGQQGRISDELWRRKEFPR